MGVITYDMEVTSPIPPDKLFKAFVLDNESLIHKIIPQAITDVHVLQGDGGPGTIRKVIFGQGTKFNYVKHKIELIDKEKFIYKYSVIEGDVLMNVIEKICNEIKFELSDNGGSICKNSSTYYTIGDFEPNEEQIKAGKQNSLQIFKVVEAYLLANPDYYN